MASAELPEEKMEPTVNSDLTTTLRGA
jgi:hypothetical protein